MKGRIRKPSPALILAFCALVAALGGTAVALPGKNNVDRNDLRKRVVKPINVKKNAIRTYQLAPNSIDNRHTKLQHVGRVVKTSAAANQGAAPILELYRRGPLQVYAKCYLDAAVVRARVYLRTFQPQALLASQEDSRDGAGAEPAAGYVNPGESEDNHEISNDAAAALNSASQSDGDDAFRALWGNIGIQGQVAAYAKQGALPNGDGPYGAGNRCIFNGSFTGIG